MKRDFADKHTHTKPTPAVGLELPVWGICLPNFGAVLHFYLKVPYPYKTHILNKSKQNWLLGIRK